MDIDVDTAAEDIVVPAVISVIVYALVIVDLDAQKIVFS